MNIYVLIEDEGGVKSIYENWISYVNPQLTPVEHPMDLVNNNFVVISGQGYPQYINRIKNALKDAKSNPAIDRLVIAVDSEDCLRQDKHSEVENIVKSSKTKKDVRIVIQHFCFETWALGNKAVFPQRSADAVLRRYKDVLDVSKHDPELLPAHDDMNRSGFAFEYLRKVLREKSPKLIYTKRNPGDVAKRHYYDKVADRLRSTGHIDSFQAFQHAFV